MKLLKIWLVMMSVFVGLLLSPMVVAQTPLAHEAIIPLYPTNSMQSLGVPEHHQKLENGETLIYDVSEPTLELFRPAHGQANGTAIIIAPGGGFVALGYTLGGTDIAQAFTKHGVTAFVLKYRTIKSGDGPMRMPQIHMKEMELIMSRAMTGTPVEIPIFAGEPNAIQDGIRAMEIVQQHAKEFGIDPHRIGFIGFSSGAYLAADLAIGLEASRPGFVGLIYGGLRTPVPTGAPPAFIAAAADDEYQPQDALLLYNAWRRAGAEVELHIYEHGGHGFDLQPKGTTSDHWFDEFIWWMKARGLLDQNRN